MTTETQSARLQLKIVLDNVNPPVWRRVVVADSLSFLQLHRVIQRAMGWEDDHLHQFELANPRLFIGTEHADDFFGMGADDPRMLSESNTRLADVLQTKRKLRYWYDFGDDWWHTIAIEKRLPADPAAPLAELLAGEGACPPEDCGGPWGYADMLETLSDQVHPERGNLLEWLGEDFDPASFDLSEHAKAVASTVRKQRR